MPVIYRVACGVSCTATRCVRPGHTPDTCKRTLCKRFVTTAYCNDDIVKKATATQREQSGSGLVPTTPSLTSPPQPGSHVAASQLPSATRNCIPHADDEVGRALREAARQRERLAAALAGGEGVLRIVIDCGFVHTLQSHTELRSLSKQVQSAVGHNRRAKEPACLQVTSWAGELAAYSEERMGAAAWPLIKHAQSTLELFAPHDLVVLSPDAEQPLTALDPARVYVIGGIVDRSVMRGVTAGFAAEHRLEARRLPTVEHAERLGLGPGVSRRPVLNICDVVAALLRFGANGGDWADALDAAIPRRKRAAAAAPVPATAAAPLAAGRR